MLEVVRRPLDPFMAQQPADTSAGAKLNLLYRELLKRRILASCGPNTPPMEFPHEGDPTSTNSVLHIKPNSSNAEVLDVAMSISDVKSINVNETGWR